MTKRIKTDEAAPIKEYYAFNLGPRNLFEFETIHVQAGQVIGTEREEPTYLPIALDRIRRKLTHLLVGGAS